MTTPAQKVKCQHCGAMFDRARRGAMPKYCTECRVIVDRTKKRDREADARADLASKREEVRRILEPIRDYMTDAMILTAEQYIASIGPDDDGVVPLVEDRMPAGTATPGGPDEGMSTTYPDLATELDQYRIGVIMHDWHAEHPGWWDAA